MSAEGSLALVPSEQHVELERSRENAGQACVFRDFVRDAAAALAPELQPAAPHATRLLTAEALGDLAKGRIGWPEEPPARAALAHAMDQALGRLRRASTTPSHLRALNAPHAHLLADVLERVDELLDHHGLVDARGAGWIAARRLRGARAGAMAELDGTGSAVGYGLLALEPDDLAVLESLHTRLREAGGRGVRLLLPRLSTPDDPTGSIADELERRWASLLDAPELDWVNTRPPTPLQVITARSADGEGRAVAAAILGALSRGAPPERIAVVVPSLDEAHLEPLRAALGDARIPFAEPRGRPASSSPEGRIVLGLLAVAAGPVTREQVIELLRAPGLHAGLWVDREGGAEAGARAALLAHRLREVPVEIDRTGRLLIEGLTDMLEGRRSDPNRPRPAAAAASPEAGITGNTSLARLEDAWMPRSLERLLKQVRWLGEDASTRRELSRKLFALVDKLALGAPPLREIASALRSEGRGGGGLSLRAIGEGAASVRALREVARSIVEAAASVGLADRPSAVGDFAAELGLLARELGNGLGAGPSRAGAIRIARPGDLAGLEHDLVVVMGLGERAYGGHEGDEALLDERIRRRLPGPCRPPSARERETWRKAELGWAIAGAARVVMSWSTGDEGDLATPHRLFRWAESLGAATKREPASRVSRHASPLDARSAELIALTAGAEPRGEIAERVRIERMRTAFFLDPRAPSHAFSGRVYLGDEAAKRRLMACVGGDTPERPVAVTAIERAAGCAFAGFARRVLRTRRTDDLGESADARERGTLVHRALEAAFKGLREHGGAGDDPARMLAAARSAAEKQLRLDRTMAPLRREAVAQAIQDALAVVSRAVDAGEALRFREAERPFGAGREAPWTALTLAGDDESGAPGPTVYVDGQIDRIDVSADGRRARVVDYKTGKIPAADEHGKSAFQLPLYAAVVADALGCEEVEALYVAVRHRGWIEEWPRDDAARRLLGGRRAEVGGAARKVMVSLWQGEVGPRPAKAALCSRCDARDICRRPAVAPFEEAVEERS